MAAYSIHNLPTLLALRDSVVFNVDGKDIPYTVWDTYLRSDEGNNGRIFEAMGLKKYEFAQSVYGYPTPQPESIWPTTKDNDYPALTRCVLALFGLIAVKGFKAEVKTETKPFKVGDYIKGKRWARGEGIEGEVRNIDGDGDYILKDGKAIVKASAELATRPTPEPWLGYVKFARDAFGTVAGNVYPIDRRSGPDGYFAGSRFFSESDSLKTGQAILCDKDGNPTAKATDPKPEVKIYKVGDRVVGTTARNDRFQMEKQRGTGTIEKLLATPDAASPMKQCYKVRWGNGSISHFGAIDIDPAAETPLEEATARIVGFEKSHNACRELLGVTGRESLVDAVTRALKERDALKSKLDRAKTLLAA